MSETELVLVKRQDSVGYCCKEQYCKRIAMLLKQKESVELENEKLREIFSFATGKFEKKEKEIIALRNQLQIAYQKIDELMKENERLRSKVEELQGKIKELQKIAFCSRSEKSKESDAVAAQGKKRGAKQHHKGAGRKIPSNLHQVEEVI